MEIGSWKICGADFVLFCAHIDGSRAVAQLQPGRMAGHVLWACLSSSSGGQKFAFSTNSDDPLDWPPWMSLIAIACAIAGLVFWQFQQPQHLVTRRILSVGNMNDFSWRNRVAAWEGALQITAEHPWFGAGWNHLEPLYEHYYLSPKLTESAAMAMNDYLMLGATCGIPALYCFGMYIWLCLGDGSWKSEVGTHVLKSNLLSMTCRAGAIVLLVGFWFDGGLFKLPTAATFWIFLELGSVGSAQPKVAPASA